MAARKLDKNHGFMKQIVKNQIDRNEYDKEMKGKTKMKPSNQTTKPVSQYKKTFRPVYKPPTDSKTNEDSVRCPVFKLEFIDKKENVHETVVNKTDDGISVARRIGSDAQLTEDLIRILAMRIDAELFKHMTAPR